jgi:hypothetical protein
LLGRVGQGMTVYPHVSAIERDDSSDGEWICRCCLLRIAPRTRA